MGRARWRSAPFLLVDYKWGPRLGSRIESQETPLVEETQLVFSLWGCTGVVLAMDPTHPS
jgi:hypothetical protein